MNAAPVIGITPAMGKQSATFVCECCGGETLRKRSNQRYCSKAKCQLRSKNGPLKPQPEIECPYCLKAVRRRNTRQISCGSKRCKQKHQLTINRKRRPLKRTGEVVGCVYCRTKFTKLSETHTTCNAPECREKRHKDRADERFWEERDRNPVLCQVCDQPMRVKRSRTHPACAKQLAADRKRIRTQLSKLRAEKAEAYRKAGVPRGAQRISPRMEDMKCVNSLRRTS